MEVNSQVKLDTRLNRICTVMQPAVDALCASLGRDPISAGVATGQYITERQTQAEATDTRLTQDTALESRFIDSILTETNDARNTD